MKSSVHQNRQPQHSAQNRPPASTDLGRSNAGSYPRRIAPGTAPYLFSSSLTSVNSASTTSSLRGAPWPPASDPPPACAAAAAYSDCPASSSAFVLASIWPLSSPFIAVSSSPSADS